MNRIFAIAIDTFSAAIIIIPILIIFHVKLFKGMSFKRKFLSIIFSIYLAAVFSATGIPNVNYIRYDLSFNFIPFIDMISDLKEPLLNIILFIPLGLLLPMIWKQFHSLKNTVILGLCLTLFIEILQIFTFRLTDVNDLITNTVGTLVGYLIISFVNKKVSPNIFSEETLGQKKEFLFHCGITFLVVFFVSPFISNTIWLAILK